MASATTCPECGTRILTPWETSQTEIFLDAVEILFTQLQQIQNQRARVFAMYCRRTIGESALRLGWSHSAINEYLDNEGSPLLYRDYLRPLFDAVMDSIPHIRRHLKKEIFNSICAESLKDTIETCIWNLRVQNEAEQALESLLNGFDFSTRSLIAISRYQKVVGTRQ